MKNTFRLLLAICTLAGGLTSTAYGNTGNGEGNGYGIDNGNGKGNAYGHGITAPELSLNSLGAGITALTVGGMFLRRRKSR